MTKVTDEQAHEAIREASGLDTRSLEFHTIPDQVAVLRRDVERICAWPYLPDNLLVAGGVYDVETGRLDVLVQP
jgi:carbonic anhydrase